MQIRGRACRLGGPNLVTTDTDSPLDGIADATEILNWINAGAPPA